MLGKQHSKTDCEYLLDKNNKKICDKYDIANEFNEFYINVGPNLAKEISDDTKENDCTRYLQYLNVRNSMFIYPTNEQEIISVFKKFTTRYRKMYMVLA